MASSLTFPVLNKMHTLDVAALPPSLLRMPLKKNKAAIFTHKSVYAYASDTWKITDTAVATVIADAIRRGEETLSVTVTVHDAGFAINALAKALARNINELA